VSLGGTRFSRLNAKYVLRRSGDDTTLGPTLTRWEMRAMPANGQATRWTIPIVNHESVNINGDDVQRDPLAEYDRLMELYSSRRLFTLQESGRTYYVQAKNFQWKPEKLSSNGKSWQGIYTIVVEEIR